MQATPVVDLQKREKPKAEASGLTKTPSPADYLNKMELFQLRPTFWTSSAYLVCVPNIQCIEYGGSHWLEGEEEGICLFPPINSLGQYDLSVPAWAIPSDQPGDWHMLDWEYIYYSQDFLNLSGGRWAVFRKNSRKWPRDHQNWKYDSIKDWNHTGSVEVLEKWLESRNSEEEIQDGDLILKYLSSGVGNVFGLWLGDKLVGINCWDSNHQWINFRYSFADPGEKWLSEFLRLLFYQSQEGWINDGGILDNPNLERFKDKLHPREKRKVMTSLK